MRAGEERKGGEGEEGGGGARQREKTYNLQQTLGKNLSNLPGDHRLKKTFQICREITNQKTRTVLILLQHEVAPREITAQKTRTVLFVLQQDKGVPDNRGTSEPTAVLFALQTQSRGSRTIGGRWTL